MPLSSRTERRQHLAEATWRVILDRGIGAVSVRSVAAEAGVAVGSLRNLFPTQAELLEFSAEHMIRQASARVTAIAPDPDPLTYAVAAIRELIPVSAQTRREFEVNIALIAETPAHPRLAAIRDEAHDRLLEFFVRLVAMLSGGEPQRPETARAARRLLALADGLGLHLLHRPSEESAEWAVDILREELASIQGDAGRTAG
ncbi:TetR/AcrR family transcriptional regulator [Microbacterium sp. SORGH_AS_0888]|uniref:TetR/AcrR family transcriptional regulator n=1 Tax=Microbacterium sp. SORGH_AS_0888 TaxID=3041791 RepID=UPI002789347B|nr:TetR family transcriptional regulator C-terminal domain-containing protein [Microbacterium sp. SORGH_AS_0888]MDQ1128340.1 AcrR family transcriptional regulator [Microbacterium sp. SORGH_AS_0888]